ncbi:hypothetical protein C8P63_11415 [Melghirimyces profundicolus]|uniref:Uncharacterized protein n=1 Tax=Melghirimyces profundicolus TaxID=1242148 RepID=A0A2T6BRY5_9BACL|nr:hypothetical protein C8P63_11415 [Melghirimyces profundicolus]
MRKIFPALLLGLLIWMMISGIRFVTVSAPSPPTKVGIRQVWWVNIPGLTLKDLRHSGLPHVEKLMKLASVGAMNMKTGGRETLSNSYATLATGTRAVAPAAEVFYHPEEPVMEDGPFSTPAGTLYARRMGETASAGSIVYPGIMKFVTENEKTTFTVRPGGFAEALKTAGYSTLVLGNLDEGAKPVRYAPLITMDGKGITEEGRVGRETLLQDPARPFGVKTRYFLLRNTLLSWEKPGVAVVELGDLHRLEQAGDKMSPLYRQRVRARVLGEIDRFLGEMLPRAGKDRLLVLTATGGGAPGKEGLFPVVMYRKGEPPGLLTSATTRRTGVVGNIDLAATLLEQLGVQVPREMLGRPMNSVSGTGEGFWRTVDRVESIYSLRPSVLYSYILLQILVLLTGLSLILKNGKGRGWMESILLAVMLTPFLFLVISGMTAHSWWLFSGALVLGGLGLAYMLTRADTVPLFLWAGLLGFLPVVVDGLMGGPLIQQSFLGYDPIKGARYYGIGNEYMGVVLGSSILASAAWLERRPTLSRRQKLAVGLFFFALLVFFAAPFWGTNAGGAMASAVGFGVAYFRFFQTRWNRKLFFKVAGMAGIGLLTLLALNSWVPGHTPTHIGRAFSHLEGGNFEEIAHILNRKLEMNLKLVRASSWGKVFLLSLLTMAILSFRPAGGMKMLMEHYPQLFNGFTAILSGSLAALAFNDSGIVSAATAIVYVVMPIMIIGIRERSTSRHGNSTDSPAVDKSEG